MRQVGKARVKGEASTHHGPRILRGCSSVEGREMLGVVEK